LPVRLRKTVPVRLASVLLVARKGRLILLRQREARAGPLFRWFAPERLAQIPLSTTARKALKLAGCSLTAQ